MPKREYNVSIQVIEVWRLNIEAESENDALDIARNMSTEQIRSEGSLGLCETDYEEIIGHETLPKGA